MADARAFWVVEPGRGEIRRQPLPDPRPGTTLVETRFSGISRGTEALVFRGGVPASQYQAMRAPHQEGAFPGPVKYGYSNVGRVAIGPEELIGRCVFSLFPHQTRFLTDPDSLTVLPADIPPDRAVLAANMETALNAAWDARLGDGVSSDAVRVAVIGAGVVGCLTAYLLARLEGLSPVLVDLNPARRRVAEALGLKFAFADEVEGNLNLIVHASGQGAGLRRALELAAFEATVLELSWYGTQSVTLPLGEAFHSRRLTLRSSQVGAVAAAKRASVSHRDRRARAVALLDDPRLDVLIDGESPFDALPETMAQLAEPGADALCHRIRYD